MQHVIFTWHSLIVSMHTHSGLQIAINFTHILTPTFFFFLSQQVSTTISPSIISLPFPTIHRDLTTWEGFLCWGKIRQKRVTFCFALPAAQHLPHWGTKPSKAWLPSIIRPDAINLILESNFLTFCLKIHLFLYLVPQWTTFHFYEALKRWSLHKVCFTPCDWTGTNKDYSLWWRWKKSLEKLILKREI